MFVCYHLGEDEDLLKLVEVNDNYMVTLDYCMYLHVLVFSTEAH